MEEAVPFYRDLLAKQHQAMLTGDIEEAMALRSEAHLLAEKLNGYAPGILADEEAPDAYSTGLPVRRTGQCRFGAKAVPLRSPAAPCACALK